MEASKSSSSFWLIMSAIFIGNFLAVLSITTINVTFPVVMDTFGSNLSTVQWLMAGYLLATGIVAPIVGYMGDQLSYKRLLIISLIGFMLFSALCAAAWSIYSLITFRIIQGIFGGMIIPITMTIIYQVFERERQAYAMGLWSLASMLAPVIGPTLGGWMVQYLGWKSIFLLNLPIGVLSVWIVGKCIPYYKVGEKKSFDTPGFLSVVFSSTLLLIAFSHGGEWGWGSLKTMSLMFIGLLLLAFFIRWELKTESPLLQLKVFRFKRFRYSLILNCIVTVSMYTGTLLVPLYLQTVLNLSPMDTGLIMLPGAIAMAAAAPIVGRFYHAAGPFKLVLSGIFIIVVATALFSRIGTGTSVLIIALLQLVRCVGIALCSMPLTNAGMSAVSREYSGHASSITNWARQGLASLSIAVFSALIVARSAYYKGEGISSRPLATTMGIDDVFLIGTLIAVAALPLTFLLNRKEQSPVDIAA
ncbi:DHA2 family efflux MFS transporter permease subunit [Paenibacillus lemnae]|uniref:DHA2 family efflux MFS transporter permease subunit n=1 Tax=Paenibacillus lemnae TaxID=1330551 RepID=A0A848MD64_PAELE|nr:DHA2 family efflux MFS transporter permease subunit [Paenibacillus lemnae]NMO98131.1 DHA2 family efflux MFS transporter permease subunit [Paenibacillus lemnae]